MAQKRVSFANESGDALSGILDSPATARACALFAHCFTCSKDLKAAVNLSRALTAAGIAVLRFDFTGLGESEGDFADTSFSGNVADLVAAARFLEREHMAPAILIGHSLGGTAILQAADSIPSAVAVATIGAPARPAHVAGMLEGSLDALAADGEATVQLGGRPFRIRQHFIDDLERHRLPQSIAGLGKALRIFNSPADAIVGIDNASELFLAARHPKSFVSLDQSDHLLTRAEDSRYVGTVLAAWAGKYLAADRAEPELLAAAGETVARVGAQGFRADMCAAGYGLIADEPESQGGTGLGPSPYDLLSAALASCTAMTLRMYADHKKLPLESATVRIRHDKVHARDCADCETVEGKVDEFRRVLALEGRLDDAQRKRLLEIADRCPVHRTLHGEVRVRTSLE